MAGRFISARMPAPFGMEPVRRRLTAASPCSSEFVRRLEALAAKSETLPPGTELQTEGRSIQRPRYLISGWACRYRNMMDGRRQIFDVVLPGEGIGVCLRPNPLAKTSIASLTPVQLVDASPLFENGFAQRDDELRSALEALADADERRMLNQIVRLGRQSALERLAHVLLDLRDRLATVGQAEGDRFPLPLTQDTLADLIGLSVVHVNRTMQELRRQGLIRSERGGVRLLDRRALEQMADYSNPLRPGRAP